MPPILVVPGLGGSESDHWQSHLERALPGAVRVEQDDWDRPRLADWLPRLAEAVAAWPGAILVAHSLGCPLVVQLAVRRPDLCIASAVLVAPANVDALHNAPYVVAPLGHGSPEQEC
jgi:serine hydrolase